MFRPRACAHLPIPWTVAYARWKRCSSPPWSGIVSRAAGSTTTFSPDTFISHGTGDDGILIAWWHVERGLAPWKHEAAHLVLQPRPPYWADEYPDSAVAKGIQENWPDWLIEGLPDYVAARIEAEQGLIEGDVFDTGGAAHVDAVCHQRAQQPDADSILVHIPGPGTPAALFTSRRGEVAPLFYGCAHSFVKFLVERLGLPAVIALVPERDPIEALEKTSGQSVALWRSEWLRRIAQ